MGRDVDGTGVQGILEQLRPSVEQWPAITERARDVAVIAGAGSGKTRTLVARYLSLLADDLDPRALVAITFTVKAAREMRNRVRRELSLYLERPDLAEAESARWREIYGRLDAARIGTIHSLCSEILRAHPAEAGVDPEFAVLEEGQANILRAQALDAALAWAAGGAADVAGLFALAGERALRKTLEDMLARRLDTAACLAGLPDPIWPVWEECLLGPVRRFLADPTVQAGLAALLELRAAGQIERAELAGDGLAPLLRELLAAWDLIRQGQAAGDWGVVAANLAPLFACIKLNKGKAANWRGADLKPVLRELRETGQALLGDILRQGLDLAAEQRRAEALPAWRALFEQAAAGYVDLKRARQALDFDDLEAGALQVLQAYPAARARWQRSVAAILVDEFQDTNERQRTLLRALSSQPGGFFMVGDDKQSIYRFRGADVAVFQAERQDIVAAGGFETPLNVTYRAHAGLIDGMSPFLRDVLGPPDPAQPWRAGFVQLQPERQQPGPGCEAPYVELHLALGSKADGALERAADALAARLVELVEDERPQVAGEDGALRPLHYGDIAILCRAARAFEAYENALERASIPFLTVAGRGFYARPEIRDLLNALAALADRSDDVALAGLLRSPAIGLPDSALFRLRRAGERLAGEQGAPGPALWDALLNCRGALPAPEAALAARAAGLIASLGDLAGRVTVAELLKAFLDRTYYRAALVAAGQGRALRNVAKLLADAHLGGMVSVGEFLAYVAALRDNDTHEGEARALPERVVQIMTIHAAKGLEFPVVIIGDAGHRRGGGRTLPLLHPTWGLLLPAPDENGTPSYMYHLGRQAEEEREDAESARLLYVAATRARERLIFSGCVQPGKDGRLRRDAGWLGQIAGAECALEIDATGCDPAGDRARACPLAGDRPAARAVLYEGNWAATGRRASLTEEGVQDGGSRAPDLPAMEGAGEAAWPSLPPDDGTSGAGAGEGEAVVEPGAQTSAAPQTSATPQRVWRVAPAVARPRAPAWVVGSVVHDALAGWRFPDGDLDVDFRRWAEARARSYGLTDRAQITDALSAAARLLDGFRGSELYSQMSAAERRLHEVPYSLETDGVAESRIIDALYRQAGHWTLVEFKTDEIRDKVAFEALLARRDYREQAERYRDAVRRLLDETPRTLLCLLNYAGGVYVYPL